jgi:hypothetical protein
MYKLIYLPTAQDIVDGNSTCDSPVILTFALKKDAKTFICRHNFYITKKIKAGDFVYSSSTLSSHKDSIRKYLIEIIKVEDV